MEYSLKRFLKQGNLYPINLNFKCKTHKSSYLNIAINFRVVDGTV